MKKFFHISNDMRSGPFGEEGEGEDPGAKTQIPYGGAPFLIRASDYNNYYSLLVHDNSETMKPLFLLLFPLLFPT